MKPHPPRFGARPFRWENLPDDLAGELERQAAGLSFRPVSDVPRYDPDYDADVVAGISGPRPAAQAPLDATLMEKLFAALTPLVEAWAGCPVERSQGYGIRSYARDAVLHLHRDRIETHILSCIIHVQDHSEVPWPLDFIDHDGRHHRLLFNPGQVLLYESLCPHGRLTPFQGEHYRNLYLHWRPRNWDPQPLREMRCKYASLEQALADCRPEPTPEPAVPLQLSPPATPRTVKAWRLDTPLLQIYEIPQLLSPAECQELIALINTALQPSTVTVGPDDYRTSRTCHLAQLNSEVVRQVDARLAALVGVDPACSEPLQGQRYDPGQYFRAHTDWFTPGTKEFEEHCRLGGQRTWTVMVYLNTVVEGGETHFPEVGRAFTPIRGQGLAWNNLHADDSPNGHSLHEALPVQEGCKWVITKWFRQRPGRNG